MPLLQSEARDDQVRRLVRRRRRDSIILLVVLPLPQPTSEALLDQVALTVPDPVRLSAVFSRQPLSDARHDQVALTVRVPARRLRSRLLVRLGASSSKVVFLL